MQEQEVIPCQCNGCKFNRDRAIIQEHLASGIYRPTLTRYYPIVTKQENAPLLTPTSEEYANEGPTIVEDYVNSVPRPCTGIK